MKGSALPVAGGSGVLVKIEHRRYLITASHVFEAAIEGRNLAVIIGKEFVDLSTSRRWRIKAGLAGSEDRTDLAIVSLGIS